LRNKRQSTRYIIDALRKNLKRPAGIDKFLVVIPFGDAVVSSVVKSEEGNTRFRVDIEHSLQKRILIKITAFTVHVDHTCQIAGFTREGTVKF